MSGGVFCAESDRRILILSATAGAGVVYGNELKKIFTEHGLSAICIWTNQGR